MTVGVRTLRTIWDGDNDSLRTYPEDSQRWGQWLLAYVPWGQSEMGTMILGVRTLRTVRDGDYDCWRTYPEDNLRWGLWLLAYVPWGQSEMGTMIVGVRTLRTIWDGDNDSCRTYPEDSQRWGLWLLAYVPWGQSEMGTMTVGIRTLRTVWDGDYDSWCTYPEDRDGTMILDTRYLEDNQRCKQWFLMYVPWGQSEMGTIILGTRWSVGANNTAAGLLSANGRTFPDAARLCFLSAIYTTWQTAHTVLLIATATNYTLLIMHPDLDSAHLHVWTH